MHWWGLPMPTSMLDTLNAWSTVAVAFFALVAIVIEVVRDIRRSGRDARDKREREAAVDARLSAIAYALRRQLRSWLDEAPEETKALVEITDVWIDAARGLTGDAPADPGNVPGATPGMELRTVQWALRLQRDGHFTTAESRTVELVSSSPNASSAVRAASQRAYVLFYSATGRLSREVERYKETAPPRIDLTETSTAYHELEQCSEALAGAVGVELREAARTLEG